jgi:sRNA-binding protein
VSQARFQKQQREKARRERAAAKSARRVERANADAPEPAEPAREQADVLAELATLHARFDAGEMSFEDFEVAKQQVTDQLDVR